MRVLGISMDKKQLGLKLSAVSLAVLLASCGGGGSDGYYNQGNSNSNSNNNSGSTPVSAVNITNISLYDTNNISTNTVTADGVTAKVKVTDQTGNVLSGALVTFTASGGVTLGTSNGAVLTNADGVASISVKPSSITDTGSYQLTASVDYLGKSANTNPAYFSLQPANISLSAMKAVDSSLESGASTNITLKTKNLATNSNQNNITVNFSSTCGTFEPVTVISSNQGDVTTTYKAISSAGKLCEGKQIITASGTDASVTQSIQVDIAAIEANSLVYTSSPVNLGIQSSGSASSGQIEFTLYANGTPAENKEVQLELMRAPEGSSFITIGNTAIQSVKSNSSGKVIVNVYPGNKPGPVEIKASLKSNLNVYALSKEVAVATGRVSQDHLSLSMSKNSLQNEKDGDSATITALMADRNGNKVPDGTVISFVAEGGSINPNCASKDGQCSVTLITQNPRPADNRVTVLAYIEGDKSYTDLDGDNLYNAAVDKLDHNLGDFFRDDNEDNLYNSNLGEYLYKRGASGAICEASKIEQPNIAGTCDNGLDAVLRQQLLFSFASNTPTFYGVSGTDTAMTNITSTFFTFQVYGNSAKTVPMPSGTTIAVATKDNTDTNNISCEAEILSGDVTVPAVIDLSTPALFALTSNSIVKYGVRTKNCALGDDIKVTVTAPNKTTTRTITLY